MSDYFVECKEWARMPFIVCGDLPEHEAIYHQRRYSEIYPASTFTVKKHGTYVCKHGVSSRDFCHDCEG